MSRNKVIIGATLCTVLLLSCTSTTRIEEWKSERVADLRQGSVVARTAAGLVEYAVIGEGSVSILESHGSMSTYREAVVMGEQFTQYGIRMICPSRPGYLRTPLSTGKTAEEQADTFAALLDNLNIESVIMIGASGGGPSALYFAWKYPDRCEKLILISAVIEPLLYEELNVVQRFMMKRALSDRAGYRNYHRLEDEPRKAIERLFPDSAGKILE
ncbi:MAG: alpha/beta hydrolase, partial [Spirochaetales bacterium]|nr:alpha/beta hydrolase [Spirochaetales bacterium]